jgi:hypothetical protein
MASYMDRVSVLCDGMASYMDRVSVSFVYVKV